MERIAVDSSNIVSIGYDVFFHQMEVEFSNGNIYVHNNIPKIVYDDFMIAESKGKYYAQYIKGKYEAAKIEGRKPIQEKDNNFKNIT